MRTRSTRPPPSARPAAAPVPFLRCWCSAFISARRRERLYVGNIPGCCVTRRASSLFSSGDPGFGTPAAMSASVRSSGGLIKLRTRSTRPPPSARPSIERRPDFFGAWATCWGAGAGAPAAASTASSIWRPRPASRRPARAAAPVPSIEGLGLPPSASLRSLDFI